MVFHLLPDEMFGQDTDDILAYATPKVAYVRDRYVGALYYSLTLVAMCWVIGGQVLWRNEHFMLKDVKGISRMFLTHPTKNQCDANKADCLSDFKALSDLSYCTEHEGGEQAPHSAPCIYADKHSMFPDGTVGSQVFIPTSLIVMEEKEGCKPGPKNDYSCRNEYKKTNTMKGYYFNETNMQFYANIEDYTVQMTSTYHRAGIGGTSLDHPGFYMECFDKDESAGREMTWKERLEKKECSDERRLPVECMPGVPCDKGSLKTIEDVKIETIAVEEGPDGAEDVLVQLPGVKTSKRSLRTALEQEERPTLPGGKRVHFVAQDAEGTQKAPDVYASTWGDTFKIGKLISMAGINLDKHYNMDKMSARMAGTILEVEVMYSNLRKFLSSFGLSQVQYTYRVKERKLPYISREFLHPEQPADFPKNRRYLIQHGILLDFKVGGEFGFFSIVYLLIMLTTSMALLATAHKLTDITSLYLHPRRNNYFHLKYEVSGDFSDMWKCEKCDYYNLNHDKTCKGMEKWMSAVDTHYCGEARPEGWNSPRHSVDSRLENQSARETPRA